MCAMWKHFKLKSPGTLPAVKIYVKFGLARPAVFQYLFTIYNKFSFKRKNRRAKPPVLCVEFSLSIKSDKFLNFKPMPR